MFYTSLKTVPCRVCGRPVVFIKLPSGKKMPCDAQAVRYRNDVSGTVFYGPDGCAEKGIESADPGARLRIGYRPHWANCPGGRPGYRKWSAKAAEDRRRNGAAANRRDSAEPAGQGKDAKPKYEQLALFEYY